MGLEMGTNSKTHKRLDNYWLHTPSADSVLGTVEALGMYCHSSFAEQLLEINANMISILEMRT